MTVQKNTWGYNRNTNLTGYYTANELIDDMVIAVRYIISTSVSHIVYGI